MQAVIMAGGKGTRLRSVTNDELPKPMAPVSGKPILQWQLESLRRNGIDNVILVTGYLGGVIEDYFGDGSRFGIEVSYFREASPLGTAGALAEIEDSLDADFLLVFGDVIFDVDIQRMLRFHHEKNSAATLFVHPNSHPFDSDIVITDADDRLTGIDSKNNKRDYWYHNKTNAGLYILNRSICSSIVRGAKTDLEKDVIAPLAATGGAVYAYGSPEYIKDVGTPERIVSAAADLNRGIVAGRNLKNPQRCVFLDRDGTVNVYKGLISKDEDLELEPSAAAAIRLLNQSGYLAIVVTNQPVVARGMCTMEDVDRINAKMETLLGYEGAYLDGCVFCPHHPDKGYPEENPIYKIDCECRKPKVGLVNRCLLEYNIDGSKSWFVGDTTVDLQTGINAGLHTALLMTGEAGKDGKYRVDPELKGEDLLDAITKIISEVAEQ